MKGLFTTVLSGILLLVFSCHSGDEPVREKHLQTGPEKSKTSATSEESNLVVNRAAILKDFKTWYNYTYYNIRLAQDFIGLDTDSVTIHKTNFLLKLETGDYVPFKVKEQDGKPVYMLFRLQHPNQDIQEGIKQLAATEKEHFVMEGKALPNFDFVDLNGKKYSKASTNGRILLLKCWFINCTACVLEFPELNKLVDRYSDKSDLLFISLATDNKDKLVSFLSKKQFKYAVVPHEGQYITEKLKVNAFPTHILVGRNGKIVKVTNTVEDMIPFLEQQLGRQPSEAAHNINFKQ